MPKGEAAVDDRAGVVLGCGQHGKRGRHVEHGERLRAGADRIGTGDRLGDQPVEDAELDRQRAVGGVGDLRFQLGELGGGEAHGAGHGLAVDEARLGLDPSRS